MTERKYAMTRVAAGDYLLLSNDGQKLWRVRKYTEGPSSGLEGWTRDKDVWGLWFWIGPLKNIDVEDWNRWDFHEGLFFTRRAAVDAALKPPTPAPPRPKPGGMSVQDAIKNMIAS